MKDENKTKSELISELKEARKRIDELVKANEVTRVKGVKQDITDRQQAEEMSKECESKYRSLFEDSLISLWEEDFSEVKKYVASLQDSGVKDLETYFRNHLEEVIHCASKIKIIRVNKATLKMCDASNIEELREGLNEIITEETYDIFIEELISISEGKTIFNETETIIQDLKGKKNHVLLKWVVVPSYEETMSRVIVSNIVIN